MQNLSHCMENMIDTEYFIKDSCTDYEIEKLTNIKVLRLSFDSELSFRDHI